MWLLLNQNINVGVQYVVDFGNNALMPLMCLAFVGGLLIRFIIYFTVKAEAAFALEFEKRVHKHLADPKYQPGITSFHELTRKILERTHEEHYNLRSKHRRRRFDQITSITDRIFLIVEGGTRLISDTLSQTKYLRKDGHTPRFLDIAKFVFESNPVFNRVLGIFPLGMFNDILNILPGLFVIGGIFGTFLGVMGALPELSHIDVNDVVKTKVIMDAFLLKMAFSMGTSIVGIVFSVALTVINAMLNPEGIYYAMVNKFTSALEFLWNDTTNNDVKGEVVYATDRRAVAYTNLSKKSTEPAPIPAQVTVVAAPSVVETEPVRPAPAPTVWEMPPVTETVPEAEAPNEDLGDLFERMDQALSAIDSGTAPAPDENPDLTDRIAVLKHRLQVLDTYLRKADEDRATGLMSDEMWKDETEAYQQERAGVEAQLRDLEALRNAA